MNDILQVIGIIYVSILSLIATLGAVSLMISGEPMFVLLSPFWPIIYLIYCFKKIKNYWRNEQ